MASELWSKAKKMNFSLRNQILSWAFYTVILAFVTFSYKDSMTTLKDNMNCFQDEFLIFALYFLYYLPNKNVIHDNLYVYPRLINAKDVCMYYFKIYLKSSLIYFAGINIINLAGSLIMGERIHFAALVFYIVYGFAAFAVLNLLSSVLITKWNLKYITPIVTVVVTMSYLLSLFIENFYKICIVFYGLSAPGSYAYVPIGMAALTYSICLLFISVLWMLPNMGQAKPIKKIVGLKKYTPFFLMSIPAIGLFLLTINLRNQPNMGSFSFYFDLMTYNYMSFVRKYEMSNIDLQFIMASAAVFGLCIFYFISNKYEERKLLYMLAHRYKSRRNLMIYTINTSLKMAFQALCGILATFFVWSLIFSGFKIDIDFNTLCTYLIYAAKLYVVLCNTAILVSVLLLDKNSGISFGFTFIIFVVAFFIDITTENIAIICLSNNIAGSAIGLGINIPILAGLTLILKKQIYKAEI